MYFTVSFFLLFYRTFVKVLNANVVSDAGGQKSPSSEGPDDSYSKLPSKTMSERRTRRRSTGAISM